MREKTEDALERKHKIEEVLEQSQTKEKEWNLIFRDLGLILKEVA